MWIVNSEFLKLTIHNEANLLQSKLTLKSCGKKNNKSPSEKINFYRYYKRKLSESWWDQNTLQVFSPAVCSDDGHDLYQPSRQYKSRNAYAQSKLIKVKMESELGKEVARDSLMTLENHPHKLLIKLDSTDAKAKWIRQ